MSGVPWYLARSPGLVPVMHQAATGDTKGRLQLGVITQGRLPTHAGRVQQVCIQLGEQTLAFGEKLRRFEVAVLAIGVLMQAFHGL